IVSPTPSLTSDSPSTTTATRSGTGVRRKTAVAATGSVGARIAPRTNAIGHDSSPSTTRATPATTTTVSTTSAIASSAMRPAFARRSRGDASRVRGRVAGRGGERRGVEERREEDEEDDLGLEPHARDAGGERDGE